MRIAADTHVHVYPTHDVVKLLGALHTGLGRGEPELRLAFLAERHDCHTFGNWVHRPEQAAPRGITIRPVADGQACRLEGDGTSCLFLPGRQVVARERIEILALATTGSIPDGLPAAEAVSLTQKMGGVPVIAWAPGKWWFSRGRVVQALCDQFSPDDLLLGDTALRPTVWPTPLLMRQARQRGFRVVCGSDPLPFPGDEASAGMYGSVFETGFEMDDPLTSARKLLHDASGRPVGRRGGPVSTFLRLFRHARSGL